MNSKRAKKLRKLSYETLLSYGYNGEPTKEDVRTFSQKLKGSWISGEFQKLTKHLRKINGV